MQCGRGDRRYRGTGCLWLPEGTDRAPECPRRTHSLQWHSRKASLPEPGANRGRGEGTVGGSCLMRFEKQVAVVTGGASGIGDAIVRGLLAEGANVGILDIN